MQCAANLAELSQKLQYDISGELSQAVELYIEMHDKGQTVAEFEAQPDMFREQPSAEVMFLCRLFEANQKSSSGISGVLKEYAAQCKKIDTTTADLFGEKDPSKLDKLQAAYDHYATDLAQGQEANARWKIDDPTSERVEKLKNAKSIEIGENSYEGLYELNAKSAREYVLKELRGKEYINADTGDEIEIGQSGTKKIASHDRHNKDYLRTFAAIPQMIENAVYLGEEPNEKGNSKYDKYRYYACGLKIGSRDYTARLTIGESEGKWYYDQALTEMEKGDLIERLLTLNSRVRPQGSPYGFIDKRLISLLQENSSKKWREVSEPSPEEIVEANRQKANVKAKWTNPDGSMKKGYMLAPNGKPTNLTENQWLQVRTPNFKKWFVDWEALAEAYPENEIFNINKAFKFVRKNLQGKEFTSKDGYTASLGRSGIDKMNSGLARGKTANNRLHALAFANIGKLFGNSELLEAEAPRDGDPNIKQYLKFYTPLFMDGEFHLIKITAKELIDGNRLYSLEGLDIIEKSEYRGQPRDSKENSISADYSDSVRNFVKKVKKVKGNVSKVVDENGEPLAVYHGTDNTNPDYTKFTVFKHSDLRVKKYIHFFSSSRDVAGSMGSYVYDVFLNIKKPLIIDSGGNSWGAIKDHTDGKVKFFDLTDAQKKKLCKAFECTMKELESSYRADSEIDLVQAGVIKREERSTNEWAEYARVNGYDGVIFKNVRDGPGYEAISTRADVFASFNSNQIKSATDNIGTFNTNNSDIRYSISEDDAARFKNELQDYIDGKLDNRHVFKLGTTPEVMRLVGAYDLPVELSASVLERKEAKHSLILENLSKLPEELADPIAVMQSSTIPDAITLITELPTIDRHNMLVAVHLNKRFGKAVINSIRSIYPKTQSGIQTAINRGELRYINTKRNPLG